MVEHVAAGADRLDSEALYRGCQSRIRAEQERAYTQLGRYLHAIAYAFVSARGYPSHLADDCVQDALVNIHRSIDSVKQPAAFLGFCATTLRHQCVRTCRAAVQGGHEALDGADEEDRDPIAETLASEDDLVGLVLAREAFDCLLAALARLPKKQRLVLTLQHFDGCSDREIADYLRTTPGNVQVLRNRARHQLHADRALASCLED